jgi:hypothetical protein
MTGHGQLTILGAYAPSRSRHSRNVDRLMPVASQIDRRLASAFICVSAVRLTLASYTPTRCQAPTTI